jgi:hypothetical protein
MSNVIVKLNYSVFWVTMRHRFVKHRFGTSHLFHLQGSSVQEESCGAKMRYFIARGVGGDRSPESMWQAKQGSGVWSNI